MTSVHLKMACAGAAITAAVALLAIAGIREGWVYYLPVDDFVEQPDLQGDRVRLHGTVASQYLVIDRAGLTASFDLVGFQHRLRVRYTGVIPDQFDAAREVVVEGERDETGVFQADTLLTKCASKYEASDGEAPHAEPRGASE